MPDQPKILAFAGSLRKESLNKKTVKIAVEGAKQAKAKVTYIDLKDFSLPPYDGDLEAQSGLPENAVKLQKLMARHDGFLICSPEYNSGIPGTFKNYIDWTSRPHGKQKAGACYSGKAAVIMAASPGGLGGLRGLLDLRKVLSTMGVTVLPDDFALAKAHEVFAKDGTVKDDSIKAKLEGLGKILSEFLQKVKA